jgi:hypothetical protein
MEEGISLLLGEARMAIEDRIDKLIKAGWGVVESDFDEGAFLNWKVRAADCLSDLVGPDHIYTEYFRDYVRRNVMRDVLTAEGLLMAAREVTHNSATKPSAPGARVDHFGRDHEYFLVGRSDIPGSRD